MKFTINNQTLKSVADELSIFAQGKNSVISFVMGEANAQLQKAQPEMLSCSATVMNGGIMGKKLFLCKKTTKFAENSSVTFHVAANSFFSTLTGLLAYEKDLQFNLTDASLILSAGADAEIPVELLAEENVSPKLPEEIDKSLAAFKISADELLSFARKGCYLSSENDAHEIADRVMITIESNRIIGNSTDTKALAASWKNAATKLLTKNLTSFYLEQIRQSIQDPIEKEKFTEKVTSANEENRIGDLVSEYKINLSTFSFPIPTSSFAVIRRLASFANEVQFAVTSNYCYVNTGSLLGTFTLGSTIPSCYRMINVWSNLPKFSACVVDADTILKGLNLLTLKPGEDSQIPVHLEIKKEKLVIAKGSSKIEAPCVEVDGTAEAWINPLLLKELIKSQDKGNICITFHDNSEKKNSFSIIEIRNGSLTSESDSISFMLPCHAPSKEVAETAE